MKLKIIMKYFLNMMIALIVMIASGCGKDDKATTEEHTDEHEDHEQGELSLTTEQMNLMGIELVKIGNENISGYIKASGEIMINPDNESKVGSIIPGRVSKIYVKEGSNVRKGQTLAVIENPDLISAQVEYLEAKHEFNHAKTEYERQEKLSEGEIGSKKELARLRAEYEHAVISMKSAEQRLSSYKISTSKLDDYENVEDDNELQRYYPVSAPISGNVVSRKVTVGEYIEPAVDMFYIVNTSSVYVDLNIFEKDLPFISIGQKVKVEVNSAAGKEYEGKISFINKVFDEESRTIKVRVSIDNKAGELYPKMFVSAKIYVNEGSVTAVPLSAIEQDGDVKYIFIKKTSEAREDSHEGHSHDHSEEGESHEGHDHGEEEAHGHSEVSDSGKVYFEKLQVNTGISDDEYVQIITTEKIGIDTEVVKKGTFYLKSELKKEEFGEHSH